MQLNKRSLFSKTVSHKMEWQSSIKTGMPCLPACSQLSSDLRCSWGHLILLFDVVLSLWGDTCCRDANLAETLSFQKGIYCGKNTHYSVTLLLLLVILKQRWATALEKPFISTHFPFPIPKCYLFQLIGGGGLRRHLQSEKFE